MVFFSKTLAETETTAAISGDNQLNNLKITTNKSVSRLLYYERLHFLTESNKSIFLRGLKSSIYVKKDMNLQHYSLLDPAQQA